MAEAQSKIELAPEPLRLDLGAGQNVREGFTGVDRVALDGIGIVCDLLKFPWRYKLNPLKEPSISSTPEGLLRISVDIFEFQDESVDEAHCSHFFEHIPGLLRGKFMDEVYRVLKPGAKLTVIVPYYKSPRAYQDFTHAWPPVTEESFLYFNRKWREDNKLTHGDYDLKCDFDFVFGYNINQPWGMKHEEARNYGITHYWNVIADLQMTLTKR